VTPPVTVTVAPLKLEPVMVTAVGPPAPDAGEMPVIVGGGAVTEVTVNVVVAEPAAVVTVTVCAPTVAVLGTVKVAVIEVPPP
jgi:hypothetical protein